MSNEIDKVQKRWLTLLFIDPILFLIYFLIFKEYILKDIPKGLSVDILNNLRAVNGNLIKGIIESFIAIPIMYHCSYKKKGTKLLTISVVLSYLAVAFLFLFFIYYLFSYSKYLHLKIFQGSNSFVDWNESYVFFFMLVCLIHCCMNIFWITFSLKLKKFNIKKRFDLVMSNEHYKMIFEKLRNINQIEELTSCYSK